MKTFRINNFITLKQTNSGKTEIYVKDEKFKQCKHLLLRIPIDFNGINIKSIDHASELLVHNNNDLENSTPKIDPDTEFWGHCSNMQIWDENNYDSRLLHSNLAFPLLKKLYQVGDPQAIRVYKEEIIKRLKMGNQSVIQYLLLEDYLEIYSNEELKIFLENPIMLLNLLRGFERILPDIDPDSNTMSQLNTLLKESDIILQNYMDQLSSKELSRLGFLILRLIERLREITSEHEKLKSFIEEKMGIELKDSIIIKGKKIEIKNNILMVHNQNLKKLSEIDDLRLLNNIEILYLSNNLLVKINCLKLPENLYALVLNNNNISCIKNLSELKDLEVLSLNHNNLDSLPDFQFHMSLKEFNCNHNKINSLKGLEGLFNLEILDLSYNKIQNIEGLNNLVRLRDLNLSSNEIKQINGLKSLRNLHFLNLKNNFIKKIEGLENQEYLIKLGLSGNNINKLLIKQLLGLKKDGFVKNPKIFVEYCKQINKSSFDYDFKKLMDLKGESYYCTFCKKTHSRGKVYIKHIKYIRS